MKEYNITPHLSAKHSDIGTGIFMFMSLTSKEASIKVCEKTLQTLNYPALIVSQSMLYDAIADLIVIYNNCEETLKVPSHIGLEYAKHLQERIKGGDENFYSFHINHITTFREEFGQETIDSLGIAVRELVTREVRTLLNPPTQDSSDNKFSPFN